MKMPSSDNKTVQDLEAEIKILRETLQIKEKQLANLKSKQDVTQYTENLSPQEISRYSRQMLIPEIHVKGQIALRRSKVLIVGAGGLGCPCALYLAAAGIGEITIVDNDEVELTNLHRQILHFESDVGKAKVDSAKETIENLNGRIKCIPLKMHADSNSMKQLLQNNHYDVVVDGSDNVATRYLLNDACVLNKIPLVSGSALKMEGQLTVYNYKNGPCYRCLFPVPPPPETVTSCGDGGVLGVVPGTIGILQALETIKIIVDLPVLSGRMLIFDASDTTFRNIKLRNKNAKCTVCGEEPEIQELIDYEQFCGTKSHDKVENIHILDPAENVDVDIFTSLPPNGIVVDVRPEVEFSMYHLPNTVNVPFMSLNKNEAVDLLRKEISSRCYENTNVYMLCRRGNDSQRAVNYLKSQRFEESVTFYNIRGGLHEYSKRIDPSVPIY